MTEPTSPRFSLAGWNWRTFFAKSKESLKWGVALLVAYLSVLLVKVNPPELQAVIAWTVGYGSKLLLNLLDFWLSDVPLEGPKS